MEPTRTQDTLSITGLPVEVIYEIFRYLGHTWSDIKSLCSAARACKQLHESALDPELWKHFIQVWDASGAHDLVELHRHSEALTDWRQVFITDVFWSRTIPMPPGTVSRYEWGPGYYCSIDKLVFTKNRLIVWIDEQGDMSLGSLQEPLSSKLYTSPPGGGSMVYHKTRASEHEWEVADSSRQYKGWMAFAPGPIRSWCTLFFVYGASGYSSAKLAILDEEFMHNNRIEHILAHWEASPEQKNAAVFEANDDEHDYNDDDLENLFADSHETDSSADEME